MALVQMLMPKMGESIMEGTILDWLKKEGDKIEKDESVLEVATDKVDTDVPSTHTGILKQILVQKGDVVAVGSPIALIETDGASDVQEVVETVKEEIKTATVSPQTDNIDKKEEDIKVPFVDNIITTNQIVLSNTISSDRFYSPLVLNIARQENIPMSILEKIPGTGQGGRLTKSDLLNFVKAGGVKNVSTTSTSTIVNTEIKESKVETSTNQEKDIPKESVKPAKSYSGNHEIIQMDRMRQMIAERMVESKKISPHVTSFVEADVTNIVYWRNRMKQEFMERENVALTFTPIFIEAVVKAIKDYPMVNVSVDGDKIIVKKDINIGMAVALPSGNLIVPVIKNADQLNIMGLTKKVNDFAKRARNNKLTPDDLTDGTYTVTNVGSFGNVMGTPIIMQPQCAILALGAVVKKPAVIESPQGDTIGIRHMMFLSHSYDHRIIDGSLGGMFVRRVADYLEGFDLNRKVFN